MLQTRPAQAASVGALVGMVGVAEAERLARIGLVEALLDRELDDVGGVQPVLGVVEGEGGDPAHVGVGGDISFGNPGRDPDDALDAGALADQLHDPGLVLVGDREGLARAAVAVFLAERVDDRDGLAGRLRPLEGQHHQAVVVELALAVDQLAAAAGGRLAERELVFVHQADDGVGRSACRTWPRTWSSSQPRTSTIVPAGCAPPGTRSSRGMNGASAE